MSCIEKIFLFSMLKITMLISDKKDYFPFSEHYFVKHDQFPEAMGYFMICTIANVFLRSTHRFGLIYYVLQSMFRIFNF
jgi:hypothetical protein